MRLGLTSLATLVAVSLSAISCREDSPAKAAPTPAHPEVEVVAVRSQKLNTTERLPAEIVPYESVDVYAKETGFVKSIKVDRGSRIRQGELLAELDAPELTAQRAHAEAAYQSSQAQLAAARAKLSADRATYEHMSAAARQPGVVAGNDLEIAQQAAQSDDDNVRAFEKTGQAAMANVRAVSQLESYLRITAPFDGEVTARYVHPGALTGPEGGSGAATPIVHIETVTRYRLVIPVPENDLGGISNGTRVAFTVPSFPGRAFRAPIARIAHAVDPKTRTMPVELDVKDPEAEIVPGSFCQVEWPIRRSYPTLFVPSSAVSSDLQRTFVVRVRQNHAEWVDVTTGVRAGNLIEVFGELRDGDLVAVRGTDQFPNGAEVSPRPTAAR